MGDGDSAGHILAVLVLDIDGERLATRYNTGSRDIFPDIKSQMAFEKRIIQKLPKPAQRNDARAEVTDVAIIDDHLVIFKSMNDVFVCVVSSTQENEMILMQLVDGLFASLSSTVCTSLFAQGLSKRAVLEGMEMTILILDEVQDDGVVMEIEEEKIVARVKMHASTGDTQNTSDAFAKATESTKNKILGSLFRSG